MCMFNICIVGMYMCHVQVHMLLYLYIYIVHACLYIYMYLLTKCTHAHVYKLCIHGKTHEHIHYMVVQTEHNQSVTHYIFIFIYVQ